MITDNANGAATVTVTLSDDGGTSDGGVSGPAPQNFTITVNDAPANTMPGAQNVHFPNNLTFMGASTISMADDATPATLLQISLSVMSGTLSLSPTTSLIFTTGDSTGDAAMTFTRTLSNISSALNGLVYKPTPGFNGIATLTITTDD